MRYRIIETDNLPLFLEIKMSYPTPPESRSSVRRAGRAIADGTAKNEDIELVDRWRSSHGYVINTFQTWIKRHIAKHDLEIEFAQRLKRKRTVTDKLRRKRPDGSPLIADVTTMHDFAGCRMIFESIEDLQSFRAYMHSSEVVRNVKHELRTPVDRYDYIQSPKSTGYRGIHDIYRHFPRRHRPTSSGIRSWDGLMVEVQYRTRAQHAWATAVEISDILDGERTKFELQESERGKFFAVASEIIARAHENRPASFADVTLGDLRKELQILENKLGIMQRLEALKQFEDEEKLQRHNVLNIFRGDSGQLQLEVIPFSAAAPAIEKATQLESDGSSVNAVYVRADNPKQLRSAYRNYFNDPVDFVKLLKEEAELRSQ